MGDEPRLIPATKAAEQFGISRVTMARLVREGTFTIYQSPTDRRVKLVDENEIRAAIRPVAVQQPKTPPGKAAGTV